MDLSSLSADHLRVAFVGTLSSLSRSCAAVGAVRLTRLSLAVRVLSAIVSSSRGKKQL
jgi:hypothetical protein